jgi:hypothetical protein
VDGRLPTGQRYGDVVIHSLTANIGHVHALLISFFDGRMFSRWILTNIALPQNSHSLRGSTRDMWTVDRQYGLCVINKRISVIFQVLMAEQISARH